MSKDIYQYRHFKKNCKLTLQMFEIKPKSEESVHFLLHIFVVVGAFLMKIVMF